ncbi:MAG: hypothetical protein LC715_05390 [Gammaproteobacteria bacterium]|nr:hypothetical protein [Gammaproteobacteria bacterium]
MRDRMKVAGFALESAPSVLLPTSQAHQSCDDNIHGRENATIRTVKERHEAKLVAIPGVVGVGLGEVNGTANITVYVEAKTSLLDRET